ncbi:ubiquitin-specific protease 2 [Tasmannia lanceolata]|uniref:ubiquitin-specific protease 2 n=1 Tax=Tasmannia lanceolata TaxID=3420 RepID=UPI0040643D2E
MGKKIRKKAQSAHKGKRVSSGSVHGVSDKSSPTVEIGVEGVSIAKEIKSCSHIDKGADLDKLSSKVGQSGIGKCEDCRATDSDMDRGASKGKGKQGKKKGTKSAINAKSELKCVWVCLECGHFACGGAVGESVPRSHALLHFKRTHHPCAVQLDNPLLCWCFSCNSLIQIKQTEEKGEKKDILSEAQELIKGCSMKGAVMDVEDVWFGGNVGEGTKLENRGSSVLDVRGYVVRGLVNLGNTCFFNSVMQNLLAMDILRHYFMDLNNSVGPLTMALKKLFNETCVGADSRNVINPKTFFGCICSKAPQFRGYQQQDSHELLLYLLDGLYTEELGYRKSVVSSGGDDATLDTGPTFVDLIFGGQLSSTVCCVECGHSSIVYEPFLDLSLPVPTKKSPSRKAPISRSKRTKFPLKEGNKGGKNRGIVKTNASPVLTQCAARDVSLPSESSESSLPLVSNVSVAEPTLASAEDEGYSWIDYIGPVTESPDLNSDSNNYDVSLVADSTSQNCDISAIKDSEDSQVFQPSGTIHRNSESRSDNCGDEVSLHVQDSEVILLPYKDLGSTAEETMGTTSGSKNTGDVEVKDAQSKDMADGTSSINDCEGAGEFDGFGDLFNERETVSDLMTESRSGDLANEEMDSESNQDEVDNTNSQVSIETCLAYFTKAELLSVEHAWHCESCSKIFRDVNVKAAVKDNQSKKLRSCANGGGVRSKQSPSGTDQHFPSSTEFRTSDTGKVTNDATSASTSESLDPHMENLVGAKTNVALKLQRPISESNCTTCKSGQVQNERGLEYPNPVSNGSAHYTEVSQGNIGFDEPNHVVQDPLYDSDVPSVVLGNYETILPNSRQKDSSSKVDGGRQNESSFPDSGDELDESGAYKIDFDSRKVKRDATKRILISKIPNILTIHLKRFGQDARCRLNKLSGHVSFRDTLDLRPYLDPRCGLEDNCQYRLVGVVEHSGTMRGGHYVAYVRGEESREKTQNMGGSHSWFYTSDAHVREVSLTDVLQSEAYILFYEKVYE